MVTQEQVNGWLKDPVTITYLQSLALFNNSTASYIARGQCISSDPLITTAELYRYELGKMDAIQDCVDAKMLMDRFELIQKGEDDESVK